jgi:inosine-uridine nucleoside N-ribohydrolase
MVLESMGRLTLLLLAYFGHQLIPSLLGTAACSSTSNPDVEEYKGHTGLSPPTVYPSTVKSEANEGNF